jgi:hypothetical protein
MGFQTRQKNKIAKIIVDIPEQDHVLFKSKLKVRGNTIKEAIYNLIKQYNAGKISLDKHF